MAFTSPMTAVTGATYTAAQFNTHTRDNLNAIWVGTTAGDMDYYSSASAKARLAIGLANQVLTSNGSAPGWATPTKILDVIGIASRTSAVELTNAAYADVPDLSVTLNLSQQCTILAFFIGSVASNNYGGAARLVIDGTAMPTDTETEMTSQGAQWPICIAWYRTGMPAGNRIIKVQNDCAGASMYLTGNLIAMAFRE